MLDPRLPLVLAFMASGAPGGAGEPPQTRIQQHVVIRIGPAPAPPAVPLAVPLPPRDARMLEWKEKKANDCIKVQQLAAAAVTRKDSVDLVMVDGKRMRLKLGNECPALGFYSGFYVKPTADGKICADRDSIRSRSGRICRIEAFRTLIPKK